MNLEKNGSLLLKTIATLAILIHHCYQTFHVDCHPGLQCILLNAGYFGVSLFLFISGYGLASSIEKNSNEITKRVLPLWIYELFIGAVYIIYYFITGHTLTLKKVLLTPFWGDTIIPTGWYLQTIIVFYLVFYLAKLISNKKLITNNKIYLILLIIIVASIIYCIICCIISKGFAWYCSIFSFPLGIAFYAFRDNIPDKKGLLFFLSLLILSSSVILWYLGEKNIFFHYFNTVIYMISVMLFSLGSVLLLCSFRYNTEYICFFIGKNSLHFYVIQRLFTDLYSRVISINSFTLFFIAVLISSALTVPALNHIFNHIKKSVS